MSENLVSYCLLFVVVATGLKVIQIFKRQAESKKVPIRVKRKK